MASLKLLILRDVIVAFVNQGQRIEASVYIHCEFSKREEGGIVRPPRVLFPNAVAGVKNEIQRIILTQFVI